MRSILRLRSVMLLLALGVFVGACAAEDDPGDAVEATAEDAVATADEATEMMTEDMATEAMTEDMATEAMTEDMATEMMTEEMATEEATAAPGDSAQACDTDAIVAAVESASAEGTLEGMADDPVATAASNNPVLTTLTQAVMAAGLEDTLNSAEALTVFAPTDCAFSEMDAATMDAAMADPTGVLTDVLGFHVIVGEQIASADLSGDYTTFTEETLTVDSTTVAGQAEIVVPDVQTANATVHLIDSVLMPPSMGTGGADATPEATE